MFLLTLFLITHRRDARDHAILRSMHARMSRFNHRRGEFL